MVGSSDVNVNTPLLRFNRARYKVPFRHLRFLLPTRRGHRSAPETARCVAETIADAKTPIGDGTGSNADLLAAIATALPGHGKPGTFANPGSVPRIRVRTRSSS